MTACKALRKMEICFVAQHLASEKGSSNVMTRYTRDKEVSNTDKEMEWYPSDRGHPRGTKKEGSDSLMKRRIRHLTRPRQCDRI